MAAVGYTGGDPDKLSLSGGTMTGTLTLSDGSPAASQDYVGDHAGAGTPSDTVTAQTSFGLSSSAGTSTDYARGDHSHGTPAAPTVGAAPEAAVLGLVAVTMPYMAPSATDGFSVAAGTMVAMLWRPGPVTITNLGVWLTVAGSSASGVNGMALYDASGTLIDQTADMSTALAGTAPNWVEAALGDAQTLTADTNYYVALLTHFDTAPKVAGSQISSNAPAFKTTPPSVALTGQTSFPASFNPATATKNNGAYFLGAS